ncbi:MAG: hypothetical protein QNK11_08620 [Legionella sp.]|nr:hypothetical protein [Legionella sp.]
MKKREALLKKLSTKEAVTGGELAPLPKEVPKGEHDKEMYETLQAYYSDPSLYQYMYFKPSTQAEQSEGGAEEQVTASSSSTLPQIAGN